MCGKMVQATPNSFAVGWTTFPLNFGLSDASLQPFVYLGALL